ncbi:hypothetical protein L208DRAFT_1305354 [Tricholoma matsutake]|nr:hypothetical protein L208DRAFT_1305354 [Tricholoma matsutake 945]
MLSFALEYWQVIDTLTADWHHELWVYELSEREWIIVSQLCDVLKVLKDTTQFFSCTTPNLATIIPAMDYINDHLSAQANDCSLSPTIKASLGLRKKTLNRYYLLTDSSEVYHIAMVLHPRHKLLYFKSAKWEQEWIDTAKELVF